VPVREGLYRKESGLSGFAEMRPDMNQVRDNAAQSRFELDVEGGLAFANYRRTPSAVIITHTETPRSLRGRGIASELVQGALQLIRADGRKVIAGCGFVADYLRKHPEFADLVG
jgi:predicted GNAT family acetyltransferase